MNQILITEKVIVTRDFKKKKKIYKFNFFLLLFVGLALFSYTIYANYDRNKSEEVSEGILLGLQEKENEDSTTISLEDDIIVINALADDEEPQDSEINITRLLSQGKKSTIVESVAPDGKVYYTEAILKIPSLDIEYPVLSDTSEELLKISLNKLWGPEPNEVGNYVIGGHNYNSGKMFGKLPNIKIGAIIELSDLSGRTVKYEVYDKYEVDPTDVSCTSQLTEGKREVTLLTCNSSGKQRVAVKCKQV